jgi:Cu-processing system ATP-binding protein
MISIKNISKRFKKLKALDNINAEFQKGQVISLVGPNGSGKTTLIKSILGMVKPNEGIISVNGNPINGDPQYREAIGYMPQIGKYPDNMKIGQLFRMLISLRKKEHVKLDEELIHLFGLDKILDKPMRTLSGGTRQKVSAAIAFLFDPPILILDEPTAGLDPLASDTLKEKIIAEKRKGKLILITSHILSDLEEITTHLMYLHEGKMIFLKDKATLQEETGEHKLAKAVARIMRGEKLATHTPDQYFRREMAEEKIY